MKKVVVKVEIYDTKNKKKAMKAVSSVSGINSIAMDMNEKKMTVIGEVDPVDIVGKLRKFWHTEIDSVGPPEEPKEPEPEKGDATDYIGAYNYPYRTRLYYLDNVAEKNPNASCIIS
ncbi:heavy metal-associated isoprenylated plant protein 39-like [Macadamia integrifolia]|uniref:heavy metal-associated isoprenylated plant protein 39-like n=1 Tax=Macadamia integrifolia TaxID=60698 RepID=UPI001C4EFD9B|nr:heavy metal-associated isoprenylated plant protein 39-like [Macadamia integrifolia]